MNRKVTLNDVAKVAGVSIATVSWAVNDNRKVRIPEDTRRRVREVAERLGYRPNAMARGLAQGGSDFIGLITDGVAVTPYAGRIIEGAQDEAWGRGMTLLTVNTGGKPELEQAAAALMHEHRVRGVIYSTWYHHPICPPDCLDGLPLVLVNCADEHGAVTSIIPDEVQGGHDGTEQLLAAGHRRVFLINTDIPSPAHDGRLAGYRSALREYGVDYDPALVADAQSDQEGGYSATDKVLDSGATAVFCHNDRVAMGLYDGLKQKGIRIPEDMSVVGFDNQEVISAHLHPALTTVELPHYELGRLGVETLLDSESPQTPGSQDNTIRVHCRVIIRESITRPHT